MVAKILFLVACLFVAWHVVPAFYKAWVDERRAKEYKGIQEYSRQRNALRKSYLDQPPYRGWDPRD